MSKPWTDDEDAKLVAWGRLVGHDGFAWIAAHDLGRTAQEGRDRIAWLMTERPDFVRDVIAAEEFD